MLWAAHAAMLPTLCLKSPPAYHMQIIIYAHADVTAESLIEDAEKRFNINLTQTFLTHPQGCQLHIVSLDLTRLLVSAAICTLVLSLLCVGDQSLPESC